MLRKAARVPSRLVVYVTDSVDPFTNIGAELSLFHNLKIDEELLFLWRNAPSVIIGRNQNPYKECRVQEMEQRGVELVRRHSGGGAVYQDLGNTNFTFVSPTDRLDKKRNMDILLKTIGDFGDGLNPQASGRNDVTVNGLKISGHAYKVARGRALHHGTLLRDVDSEMLGHVLTPSKEKLLSKGVSSVRSRVTNLIDLAPEITHESFVDRCVERFLESYADSGADVEMHNVTREQLLELGDVQHNHDQLKDWKFRFGETPSFQHNMMKRFQWGIMDVMLDAKEGKISKLKIYSDCLDASLVPMLEQRLTGCKYSEEGIERALLEPSRDLQEVQEFKEWLKESI